MKIIKLSIFLRLIRSKRRIFFFICGTLILIYLIEFFLFIQGYNANRVNHYLELNKNNKNIYLSYYPRNLLGKKKTILPLSNISNAEIIECYEKDDFFTFKTDKYGFNNINNKWDQNEINILLGDELVLGSCLKDVNFANLLSKENNTLNLSNRGAGPLTELTFLREYMPIQNTKTIFWFFNSQNDLADLEIEKKDAILIKYLENSFSQNLIEDKFKLKKKIKLRLINDEVEQNLEVNKYNLFKFISVARIRYEIRLFFLMQKNHNIDLQKNIDINSYLKAVNYLGNFTKKNNINLIIIFTPLNIYYSKLNPVFNIKIKRKVKDYLKNQNIEFIDLEERIFTENIDKKDMFFSKKPRSTLNQTGHKYIFEIINNKINQINQSN